MSVLLLSADLACSSQVSGAAARVGIPCQVTMNSGRLLDDVARASPTQVLLDLNTPGFDPLVLVPQLLALPSPPRQVIAFGPHVHESRLAAAQQAGCTAVLPRGQFYSQLDQLLG